MIDETKPAESGSETRNDLQPTPKEAMEPSAGQSANGEDENQGHKGRWDSVRLVLLHDKQVIPFP